MGKGIKVTEVTEELGKVGKMVDNRRVGNERDRFLEFFGTVTDHCYFFWFLAST